MGLFYTKILYLGSQNLLMKNIFCPLALLFSILLNAQPNNPIAWININAIAIEDANPNNPLGEFGSKAPEKFNNALLYGFGEASHHGREFFNLKAKFFKYLVEKRGVRIFILEECIQAEKGINEWIGGGEGNRETIAANFNIMPWRCREVVDLLEWMRHYNMGRVKEDQIRFYGMDIQNGKGLNLEIRRFAKAHHIDIDEKFLAAADSCAERPFSHKDNSKWAAEQLPQLEKIEAALLQYSPQTDEAEYKQALRAFYDLKYYIEYLQTPKTNIRDERMYLNVVRIVSETNTKSAFIWAHNEHINKSGRYEIKSVGKHLKDHFGDRYYSVGFDFGTGILPGVVMKKGSMAGWEMYNLGAPFPNTFAATLNKAAAPIYFVDMDLAKAEPSGFFSKEKKHLGLGGPGYDPKKPILMKRNFTGTYDGLIFVKSINPPDYKVSGH